MSMSLPARCLIERIYGFVTYLIFYAKALSQAGVKPTYITEGSVFYSSHEKLGKKSKLTLSKRTKSPTALAKCAECV